MREGERYSRSTKHRNFHEDCGHYSVFERPLQNRQRKILSKQVAEGLFQNKLPKDSEINLFEETDMASTMCQDDGTGCVVKFNLKYVLARRVAEFTMLHEQCHIKIWNKELDSSGQQVEHGKVWRTCMLQLDATGAFREILIDGYSEGM